MPEFGTFSTAARGLSRNPLGIIALFIVLIYGFAALTLGINDSLQPAERLPLVWFLVIFPVAVLLTFAWLVSQHHTKLYSPGDYKADESFLQAQNRQVIVAQEVHRQIHAVVKDALQQQGLRVVPSKGAEDLAQIISKEIDQATTITVDARAFLSDPAAVFTYSVAAFGTLGDLTDEIYFRIKNVVRPYYYGHSWVLVKEGTGEMIKTARMIAGVAPGRSMHDTRALSDVGIRPGETLRVEIPQEASNTRLHRSRSAGR